MNRIVLFFVFLWSISMLHAADPVKLVSGDISVFKQEVVANVLIDDHRTIIDGKDEPADVYYGTQSLEKYEKFVADVDRGHASFITYFNEKRKADTKLTMAEADVDAEYTLKVYVSSMNVGNAGGMIWGFHRKAGGALINGTMQLVEKNTNKVVCEFEFKKVKGLLAPVFKARAISVYRYLADGLLEVVE